MKQKLFLKGILLLFALFVGGANMRADVEVKWVKVDPTTLEAGDSIVIVDTTKCVAMANDPKEGSAPKATSVTLNTNKDQLDTSKGDIAKNLKWVVAIPEAGKYQFKKDDTNFLFAKDNSDKDSLLVGAGTGDGEVNTFQLVKDQANNKADFLYAHMSDSKDYYVGIYSLYSIINTWVARTSINEDISSTVLTFFKRVESEKKDLEIKFEKDNYEFDLDGGGTFTSAIATTNPEGKTLTYSSSNEGVATVNPTTGEVTIVTESIGTVIITASFAGDDEYDATSASYTLRIDKSNSQGGMNNPYKASVAYDLIKNGTIGTGNAYFVKGVVSKIGSSSDILSIFASFDIPGLNSDGGLTYYISDDGSSAEGVKQLEVTSGRGLENGELKSQRNLCVGDEVIVVGQLSYSSSTPAFGGTSTGTGTGTGSDSESEKTSKIDKGNYLHKYTPRIIAPDTEVIVGSSTRLKEMVRVNEECEVKKYEGEAGFKLSNDNASIPDETAKLNANKVGCDTITVSCPFKNNKNDKDTLFLTVKKFYVTVKSRSVEPVGKTAGFFSLVKDASTLKETDSLLIVAEYGEKSYAISSTGALMGGMSGKEVTVEEDGTIKSVPDGATPVKLKKVGEKWAINTTGKSYFYNSVNSGGGFDLSSLFSSGDPVNKLRHGEIAGEIGDSAHVSIAIDAEGLATVTMRGDSILRYADTPINIGGSGSGNEGTEGSQGSSGSSNYNMAAFNCYSKDTLQDNLVKIYRFQYEPKFDITVGENGWRELVCAKNVELPEGLTAYTAKEVSDGKIYLEMVDQVKAEIPYIVLGAPNATYTLTAIDDAKAPEDNMFEISTKSTEDEDGVYVIDTKSNKFVFYKWKDALLGSGHVYVDESVVGESVETLTLCGYLGDANCDGKINVADIVEIENYKLEKPSDKFSFNAADITRDGKVDEDDIEEIVKIIMGSE